MVQLLIFCHDALHFVSHCTQVKSGIRTWQRKNRDSTYIRMYIKLEFSQVQSSISGDSYSIQLRITWKEERLTSKTLIFKDE